MLALDRPLEDLAEESERFVDRLGPEAPFGLPMPVKQRDAVLVCELELLGFPSEPITPALHGFMGDLS